MNTIQGLTDGEVRNSKIKFGDNRLTPKKGRSFFQVYWGNYDNPIIMILLVALGINIIFTFIGKVDWYECVGILISVLISTFVSSLSEYSNEGAFRKLLLEASSIFCKVKRNGELCEIPINDIVVGDFVLLQSGDLIPADGKIVKGRITVDQSPLNGESKEVEKRPVSDKKSNRHQSETDLQNIESVFRGCTVCSGEAVMVVDTVGDNTMYGKLTSEAQEEGRESPLSVKLSGLAKSISKFGIISAVAIIVIGLVDDVFIANAFDTVRISNYLSDTMQVASDFVSSVIVGIIVIVVAVPEGLPLMIAIVCSLNMKKMLKANVLVRKLIGIETAGGINVLFTDKTGTITQGKPRVVKFVDSECKEYESFDMIGDNLSDILSLSVYANSSARFSGDKIIGGNATEKALLTYIGKEHTDADAVQIIASYPFSSDKKYSLTEVFSEKSVTLVKGAPEVIMPRCAAGYGKDGDKLKISVSDINKKISRYADMTMRMIAIAVSDEKSTSGEIPENLTLVGIAAIRDEIRPEAAVSVKDVLNAGIQVVMITGDRAETASAIAREVGLLDDDGIVLSSEELSCMSDDEVKKIFPKLRVVSRAMPSDKSRLVKVAQSMNYVTGMTGDGVNDAPALKLADVGFAMGSGTEAAATASDIVLLDDNFKSVRNAILYGRTIYKSIKKFVKFQLTINIAAVTVSMLGPIVGIEKPLDISQMIWTNLMIDSLAAIAFGGEPALNRYMREKPRRRDEAIIDSDMWSAIIFDGLYICVLSLLFFTLPFVREFFRPSRDDIYFYTGYFTFFIFASIFNAFNARCDGTDLLENLSLNKQFIYVMSLVTSVQIFITYFGGKLMRTAGLNLREWFFVIFLAGTILPGEFLRKKLFRRSAADMSNANSNEEYERRNAKSKV